MTPHTTNQVPKLFTTAKKSCKAYILASHKSSNFWPSMSQ